MDPSVTLTDAELTRAVAALWNLANEPRASHARTVAAVAVAVLLTTGVVDFELPEPGARNGVN